MASQHHPGAGNFDLDDAFLDIRSVTAMRNGYQRFLRINGYRQKHNLAGRLCAALTIELGASPLEHQVGIDAVLKRNGGHRCARLICQLQDLAFEGSAMSALRVDEGG